MDYAVNNERYFVILGLNCEKNKKMILHILYEKGWRNL